MALAETAHRHRRKGNVEVRNAHSVSGDLCTLWLTAHGGGHSGAGACEDGRDDLALRIGVVLHIFSLALSQFALRAGVELALGLVLTQPVTEQETAVDLLTAL